MFRLTRREQLLILAILGAITVGFVAKYFRESKPSVQAILGER
jgi:hypothetical protein